MNKNFKIYIIHYTKLVERKIYIESILNNLDIEYEFIESYDKEDLDSDNIKNFYDDNRELFKKKVKLWGERANKYYTLSEAEISCTIKHIEALKSIRDGEHEFNLILEDDAFFLNKFTKNLKKFISINFKYKKQIILLSELREFYKIPIDKEKDYEIVDVTNAYFTHSYFINNEAARSLLHFNFPVKTVADNFIIFKIYCGIKITGLNPYLLGQDKKKFKSSIKFTSNLKQVFLFKRFIYKSYNKILKKLNKFESHKG